MNEDNFINVTAFIVCGICVLGMLAMLGAVAWGIIQVISLLI